MDSSPSVKRPTAGWLCVVTRLPCPNGWTRYSTRPSRPPSPARTDAHRPPTITTATCRCPSAGRETSRRVCRRAGRWRTSAHGPASRGTAWCTSASPLCCCRSPSPSSISRHQPAGAGRWRRLAPYRPRCPARPLPRARPPTSAGGTAPAERRVWPRCTPLGQRPPSRSSSRRVAWTTGATVTGPPPPPLHGLGRCRWGLVR
mmetsp:Transcript_9786/g.28184  ORF Transcript_9786/g.28184 Transcript_9786/m.28184 type:complete len:202 (-) Transcript_9786:2485-3090(-)